MCMKCIEQLEEIQEQLRKVEEMHRDMVGALDKVKRTAIACKAVADLRWVGRIENMILGNLAERVVLQAKETELRAHLQTVLD